MAEYAIEADPGKCTASFPTFDSLDAALAAASVPAMVREGLPLPRVLTRRGGAWYPVCVAPTRHGPCILLKDHDPHSAYHRGGGRDQFERSEYEGNWTEAAVERQCCACGVPVMLDRDTNHWVDERNQAICPAREGATRGHLPG